MRMPISENFSPIQKEVKLEKFNKRNWKKKRQKIKLKKNIDLVSELSFTR